MTENMMILRCTRAVHLVELCRSRYKQRCQLPNPYASYRIYLHDFDTYLSNCISRVVKQALRRYVHKSGPQILLLLPKTQLVVA